MPTINDEHSVPIPAPKRRRNIRTLPANQMEYLIENYPPDQTDVIGDSWSREQVMSAMQAAFNAGKRAAKREE